MDEDTKPAVMWDAADAIRALAVGAQPEASSRGAGAAAEEQRGSGAHPAGQPTTSEASALSGARDAGFKLSRLGRAPRSSLAPPSPPDPSRNAPLVT